MRQALTEACINMYNVSNDLSQIFTTSLPIHFIDKALIMSW